jgi:hypothetical protein
MGGRSWEVVEQGGNYGSLQELKRIVTFLIPVLICFRRCHLVQRGGDFIKIWDVMSVKAAIPGNLFTSRGDVGLDNCDIAVTTPLAEIM